MGKQVFIHIGPHKTGTTSIQATLRFNRDYLESCGVSYLPVGLGPSPERIHGQHNLAWALCGDHRFDSEGPGWDDAIRFIEESPVEKILISSEVFSTFNHGAVEKLSDLLSGHQITAIYMARNHLDMMNSQYGQIAQKWNTETPDVRFRRWKVSRFSKPGGASFMHAVKIAPWVDTLGNEAIRLLVFEKEKADLAGAILRAVGCKFQTTMVEERRMNSARRSCHLVVNMAICRALEGKISPSFYDTLLAPELALCAELLPPPKRRHFFVPDDVIRALEEPIRNDVARLRALGADLPPEYYDDLNRSVSSPLQELPQDVGAMLAGMLLKARRDALKARVAAVPKASRERLGAPLQRKIAILEQALADMRGA